MAIDALGIYLKEINNTTLLTREEERDLARKVESGDSVARADLINANLRLVVSYAKGYQNHGLSLEELIEEGNIILIDYVDRIFNHHPSAFNWRLDYKFSTHFHLFFMSRIKRAINSKRNLIYLSDGIQNGKGSAKNIRNAKRAVIFESEECGPLAIVSDRRASPATDLEHQENVDDVIHNFDNSSLDPRQKEVLKMRFGMAEPRGRQYTLKEIGDKFGITKERARQIQNKALRKLRWSFK